MATATSPAPHVPALVVGAGPAGLASAACLRMKGVDALVLESGTSVASSWRKHYERLHLHTVKEHSGLPGLPFGREVPRYPSRDEVVQYLERYAAHFGIAPRVGEAARRIGERDGVFEVETDRASYRANVVVVATGYNRIPNPERPAGSEIFRGLLVHSAEYRNGAGYRGKRVLVVGAGNTGAEIALDLLEHGATPTLAIRTPVNVVPRDFLGMPMQVTSLRLRFLPIGVIDRIGRTVSRLSFGDLSPFGLLRPELGPISSIQLRGRIPLIDVGTIAAIRRRDIVVKPGVRSFTETAATFDDGTALDFDAAILATGYRPGIGEMIDIAGVLDDEGYPRDWQGGGACPGLYFVGYEDVATGLLREIGLQARAVADDVARRRGVAG